MNTAPPTAHPQDVTAPQRGAAPPVVSDAVTEAMHDLATRNHSRLEVGWVTPGNAWTYLNDNGDHSFVISGSSPISEIKVQEPSVEPTTVSSIHVTTQDVLLFSRLRHEVKLHPEVVLLLAAALNVTRNMPQTPNRTTVCGLLGVNLSRPADPNDPERDRSLKPYLGADRLVTVSVLLWPDQVNIWLNVYDHSTTAMVTAECRAFTVTPIMLDLLRRKVHEWSRTHLQETLAAETES